MNNITRRGALRQAAIAAAAGLVAGRASESAAKEVIAARDSFRAPLGPVQGSWRWCKKCQGLFFTGNNTLGVCPAGEEHDPSESGTYWLTYAGGQGQGNWRWCQKCQGLFFAGNDSNGVCPAGGEHDPSKSGDYTLRIAPDVEPTPAFPE